MTWLEGINIWQKHKPRIEISHNFSKKNGCFFEEEQNSVPEISRQSWCYASGLPDISNVRGSPPLIMKIQSLNSKKQIYKLAMEESPN